MRIAPGGRTTSLLAWGLLVGGIALLITLPQAPPAAPLTPGHLPAALLFALGGFVFGLSHPDGRDWAGAVLLGWVPAVAGVFAVAGGTGALGVWLPRMLLPGIVAAAGAWAGALLARRRERTPMDGGGAA
jgi:peptidoglycan/LPS O-acetylase OafA/YrhL